MNIKVLTLIFFSSLMCIGNATEKTRNTKPEQPSSKLGEYHETLEDLKVLTKGTFNALKKENDSLKYRLWDDYGHLCVTPAATPNNALSALDSGSQVLDQDTGVEFVQKTFADFRKRFVAPIDELKRENKALTEKATQFSQQKETVQQIHLRAAAHKNKSEAILVSESFQVLMAFIMSEKSPLNAVPILGDQLPLLRAYINTSDSEDVVTLRKVLRPVSTELDPRTIPTHLNGLIGFNDNDILFTYDNDQNMTVGMLKKKVDTFFNGISLEPLKSFITKPEDEKAAEFVLKLLPQIISVGAMLLDDDRFYLGILYCCEQDPQPFMEKMITQLPSILSQQATL